MQLLIIMPIISTLSIYIRRTRIRVGTNRTDFSTSNSKLEIGVHAPFQVLCCLRIHFYLTDLSELHNLMIQVHIWFHTIL